MRREGPKDNKGWIKSSNQSVHMHLSVLILPLSKFILRIKSGALQLYMMHSIHFVLNKCLLLNDSLLEKIQRVIVGRNLKLNWNEMLKINPRPEFLYNKSFDEMATNRKMSNNLSSDLCNKYSLSTIATRKSQIPAMMNNTIG